MRGGSPPYDRYHPLHSRSCHNEKEERGKRGESSEGKRQRELGSGGRGGPLSLRAPHPCPRYLLL